MQEKNWKNYNSVSFLLLFLPFLSFYRILQLIPKSYKRVDVVYGCPLTIIFLYRNIMTETMDMDLPRPLHTQPPPPVMKLPPLNIRPPMIPMVPLVIVAVVEMDSMIFWMPWQLFYQLVYFWRQFHRISSQSQREFQFIIQTFFWFISKKKKNCTDYILLSNPCYLKRSLKKTDDWWL